MIAKRLRGEEGKGRVRRKEVRGTVWKSLKFVPDDAVRIDGYSNNPNIVSVVK